MEQTDGRFLPVECKVNSSGSENRPWVSRDGKYFFFTSTRNGSRDTFWVKAAYLEQFRR